jgi:hypothetical protein
MKRLLLPALVLAAVTPFAPAQERREYIYADWHDTAYHIRRQIYTADEDIAKKAAAILAGPIPKDYRAQLQAAYILYLCQLREPAFQRLLAVRDQTTQGYFHGMQDLYQLAAEDGDWEFNRRLLETCAADVNDLQLDRGLIPALRAQGWNSEKIEQWLADRGPGSYGYWWNQLGNFMVAEKRTDAFFQRMKDRVTAAPEDLRQVKTFLQVVYTFRTRGRPDEAKWDLAWVTETCRPATAVRAEEAALELKKLKEFKGATRWYQLAAELPLIDRELEEKPMPQTGHPFMPEFRHGFQIGIRNNLAECLKEIGETAQAQKVLEEVDKLRSEKKSKVYPYSLGATAIETGAPDPETVFEKQNKRSKDDPEYWLDYADFQSGTRNQAKMEEALRKALELGKPVTTLNHWGKGGPRDTRSRAVSQLSWLLERTDREPEALALCRAEIMTYPLADSADVAAPFLTRKGGSPEDEALWKWLEVNPIWHWRGPAPRLLEFLFKAGGSKAINRAEALARNAHPSRVAEIGLALAELEQHTRSLAFLREGERLLVDDYRRESIKTALYRAYLGIGDWRTAEARLPRPQYFLPADLHETYAQLALIAARRGDRADAVRLWKRAANLEPAKTEHLAELAEKGLGEDIRAFYAEFQKALPGSPLPGKVLAVLQAP